MINGYHQTIVKEDSKFINTLFLITTVVYFLLFEWTFFEWSEIAAMVLFLKLTIPFFLLFIVFSVRATLPSYNPFVCYTILSFTLLGWGLIPTILSPEVSEGIGQWLKFFPRLLFFLAASFFIFRDKMMVFSLTKILVFIGVFTVVQYACLLLLHDFSFLSQTIRLEGTRSILAGPFGLLGNVTSKVYMIGTSLPLARLTGFWLEPSNTAGYLFASYFLSLGLYHFNSQKKYKIMAYICLVGGFLCLSNAGYFCFGGALLFGSIFMYRLTNKAHYFVLPIIALFLIGAAFSGRTYVVENNVNSPVVKAIFGVRNIHFEDAVAKNIYDPYGGRTTLALKNLDMVAENPIGIGFRIPGQRDTGEGFESASSSAILYWLTFTGIPGVIILLLMQGAIIATMFHERLTFVQIRFAQAWMAVELQNLSYGYWFSPLYFLLVIFIFAISFRSKLMTLVK